MMLLLFVVDTISVMINSFILGKLTDVNLFQEFCLILKKYWIFIAIRMGANMCVQYSTNDINLGMDSTGDFEWITNKGRFQLISNSTDLSEEEKAMLVM